MINMSIVGNVHIHFAYWRDPAIVQAFTDPDEIS